MSINKENNCHIVLQLLYYLIIVHLVIYILEGMLRDCLACKIGDVGLHYRLLQNPR